MKQTCKRILSLALCLLLCAALLPGAVWAAEIVDSGTCGKNLTWTLDSAGKLTISGTGKMEDYEFGKGPFDAPSPWFDYAERNAIKTVVIRDGATSIGDGAFFSCSNPTSVTIPNSVTSIGNGAFEYCDSLTSVTIPNSVTSIGYQAFCWCSSLTSVTIPNSVTSIGDMAFFFDSLTDVYFTGTEQEWKAIEIGESNDPLQNAIIHFNSTGPSVVLSPQNLTVNGVRKNVEKYNIDGYNYFKLRDIAYLLNGTPAQFSVEWDAENNAARIVSGQPYTANGSELVIGADRSATAVRSPQTIVIDGEVRSDLAAFNLAGNNFFKLRDLGEALGFQVDFDAATNTAVVTTG